MSSKGDSVRIVLLDGFSGDEVVITGGEATPRKLNEVTTALLTGMAQEVTLPAAPGSQVQVRVPSRGLAQGFPVRSGNTLMVSIVDGELVATEMDGAPGFL